MGHRRAAIGVNGVLCFSVAAALLFSAHLVGVQRQLRPRVVRRRSRQRRPRRPLQRAAARRRLRGRPLGAASRLDDGRQHRCRHRSHGPHLAAPQHEELPLREGVGDAPAVPGRLRRRLPQRRQHLGRRQHRSLSALGQPRRRRHDHGDRGHHRAEDQLLGDGQPRGLPGSRRRGRRRDPQRPPADPGRRPRGRRHRLHPARSPQARRSRCPLVRPGPGRLRRLLADGAAEVRHERDAPADQPADRRHQLRGHRERRLGPGVQRHPVERVLDSSPSWRSRPAARRSRPSRWCRR